MFITKFVPTGSEEKIPLIITLDNNIVAKGVCIILPHKSVLYKLNWYSKVFEEPIKKYYNSLGIKLSFINSF